MAPSRAIKLYGTDEPVAEPIRLSAGRIEASFDAGNLRYVKVAGREAMRAVAFLVRDRNWGTYNVEISDLRIDQGPEAFTVTYDAVAKDATQELRYRARIEGRSDGRLVFDAELHAVTDFVTNRTGFVVLHALDGVVGEPVSVEHTDGRVVESRFPAIIDPACPFEHVRALTHEVAPGVQLECRMEGDAFEMEDHRNWMDASYKTYVRPLALPWPYAIPAGERSNQRVTLSLMLAGAQPAPASGGAGADLAVRIGPETGRRVAPLGLAVPPEHAAAALERAALIRAAKPAHLVCHFDARKGHDAATMAAHRALGEAVGADLVLEAVLPSVDAEGRPTDDPVVLARDVAFVRAAAAEAGVRFVRVAVSPASDLKCTLPGSVFPPAPSWAALMTAARDAFPGVPVGGGMFSFFTELNRKRPPSDLLDFVCHTGSPLVHAGDDVSMTETLQALPSIFRSARAIAGTKPYWLFPTAIAMRDNPYGAVPAENPGNIRQAMNRVDPRERALIGAAWYAGYLAEAAKGGPDALTLAAVAGPSGIISAPIGAARPWFDGGAATVTPSYHVLAGHMALAGAPLLAAESSEPGSVRVLAARRDGLQVAWISNQTGTERSVALDGADGAVCRTLDEATFERLTVDPATWEESGTPIRGRLQLEPYATVEVLFG